MSAALRCAVVRCACCAGRTPRWLVQRPRSLPGATHGDHLCCACCRGEIRTIVDYVVDMVQAPDFVSNVHHTGWLDARIAAQVGEWAVLRGAGRHACTLTDPSVCHLLFVATVPSAHRHASHPASSPRAGAVGAAALAPERDLRYRAARAGPRVVPLSRVPVIPGEGPAAARPHLTDHAARGVCGGWCVIKPCVGSLHCVAFKLAGERECAWRLSEEFVVDGALFAGV